MITRLLALVYVAVTPLAAFGANTASVIEMYPYVDGRDFPWIVPLFALALLAVYLARVVATYRRTGCFGRQ